MASRHVYEIADVRLRMTDEHFASAVSFQGQEAAIAIYSFTSSSAEDAPRGMEFLYALDRLNVATSRARS